MRPKEDWNIALPEDENDRMAGLYAEDSQIVQVRSFTTKHERLFKGTKTKSKGFILYCYEALKLSKDSTDDDRLAKCFAFFKLRVPPKPHSIAALRGGPGAKAIVEAFNHRYRDFSSNVNRLLVFILQCVSVKNTDDFYAPYSGVFQASGEI